MTMMPMPGALGALLGGITLPTIRCALCAADSATATDDEPPAVTVVAGTLTCAQHAAGLLDHVESAREVHVDQLGELVDVARQLGELVDVRRAVTP